MAQSIGTAYINIAPNMTGIQGKISGGLKGSGTNFANQFQGEISGKSAAIAGAIGGLVAAATIGIARAIGNAGMAAIKSAADMEMLRTSLDTLTGSTKAGSKMFQDLYTFAAKTPFETEGLAKATQTMLAFGVANKDVLPNLQMLGDIAMGNKDKLSGLTLAFSQVQSTGRLMGQDLLQMINSGFNPLTIISQKTGKSMKTLKEEMEKGSISASMVRDAMVTATSKGGLFYQGMAKGSKTLEGVWSTLTDTSGMLMRKLAGLSATGDVIQGGLVDKVKDGITGLTDFLSANSGKITDFVNNSFGFIKEYGTIIAGVLIGALTPSFIALAGAAGVAAVGLWAAVAPLLPFIAAGVAIGAAIYLIRQNFDKLQPTIDKVVSLFNQYLLPVINKVVGVFKNEFKKVLNAFAKVWDDSLKPAIAGIVDSFKKNLLPVLKKLEPVFKVLGAILLVLIATPIALVVGGIWLLLKALQFLAPVIGVIIQVLGTIISVFIKIAAVIVDVLIAGFKSLWSTVSTVFNAIWGVVKVVIDFVIAYFKVLFSVWKFIFDTIYAVAAYIFNLVWTKAIKPVLDLIIGGVTRLVTRLVTGFQNIWARVKPVIDWIWVKAVKPVWDRILGGFNNIKNGLVGGFNKVKGTASSVATSIGNFFSNMWTGVKNGFKAAINWIIDLANKFIKGYNKVIGKVPGAPELGTIPRFATGVENFAGGLAIVGEKGPELVNLPKGSDVIPNGNYGGNTNVYINMEGIMARSRSDLREIAKDMITAVNEELIAKGRNPIGQGAL